MQGIAVLFYVRSSSQRLKFAMANPKNFVRNFFFLLSMEEILFVMIPDGQGSVLAVKFFDQENFC